jgi:hypothetical protein
MGIESLISIILVLAVIGVVLYLVERLLLLLFGYCELWVST